MEIPLLKDVIVIFGLSIGILLICLRLNVPVLVGLLLTGVICGPHGLGAVGAVHEVELLAEVGIVLLLFGIGIELSFRRFVDTIREVLLAGGLQVGITLAFGTAVALLLGRLLGEAVFLGCLLSLSSTAIVLKLLQDRSELTAPHGKLSLSILVFQDIIVVPMMLLVPVFSGKSVDLGWDLWIALAQGLAILIGVGATAMWLVPQLLYQVARTNSRKLFLLSVLFICFSVAWVTSQLGLSLAIGAFLSGMIISESDYHHHALGNILTLQEVFTSFFFISTGMLLDTQFVMQYPLLILFTVIGVISLKAVVAGGIALFVGFPLRTAVLVGCGLCQVGEFSFLLVKAGISEGISSPFHYQLFLAVTLISMALTPFLMVWAPRLADLLNRLPLPSRIKCGLQPEHPLTESMKDHVVIVGFGRSGLNLANSLETAGISHVILEVDPEIVLRERAKGRPIHFGDATHESVLNHVDAAYARIIAVLVNDPLAGKRIIATASQLNPDACILARARKVKEIEIMMTLGASEVVPDEFESSIEIFTRVLKKYLVPRGEIGKLVEELREDQYEQLRDPSRESSKLSDLGLHLLDMTVDTVRVHEHSWLAEKTLMEANLRKRFHVTVLLIRRGEEMIWELDPNTQFLIGDIVVLFGRQSRVSEAIEQMTASEMA